MWTAVLRIHDILGWFRIRIRGSMPLMDPDPGSGSCYFHHWPSICQQYTYFDHKFFLHISFSRYFYITSFFKDRKLKRVTKLKARFFLLFFYDDRRIRIRSLIHTSGSGSGRPKSMWFRRIRNTGEQIFLQNKLNEDTDPEHRQY